MKKTVILFSTALVLALASCSSSTKEEPATVVPPAAETTPPPAPQPKTESKPAETKNPDGTSIDVSKDGLNIETQKGDKSSSVKVSEDNAKVSIKR